MDELFRDEGSGVGVAVGGKFGLEGGQVDAKLVPGAKTGELDYSVGFGSQVRHVLHRLLEFLVALEYKFALHTQHPGFINKMLPFFQ